MSKELFSPKEYKMLRKIKRSCILSPLLLDSLNKYDRELCMSLCDKGLLEYISSLDAVDISNKGEAVLRERTFQVLPIGISVLALFVSIASLWISLT